MDFIERKTMQSNIWWANLSSCFSRVGKGGKIQTGAWQEVASGYHTPATLIWLTNQRAILIYDVAMEFPIKYASMVGSNISELQVLSVGFKASTEGATLTSY